MATTEDQLITCENMKKRFGGYLTGGQNIPSGTLVFVDAANGHLTGVTNGGANPVSGVAPARADGSAAADGEVPTDVLVGAFKFYGTGFTQADVGKAAYAVDNFTVSLTGAGNSYLGTVREFISATELMIDIDRHGAANAP